MSPIFTLPTKKSIVNTALATLFALSIGVGLCLGQELTGDHHDLDRAKMMTDRPDGLIACWSGDGHANDSVGGNHGVEVNGASYATGLFGLAFSFDGVNDYIQVPESNELDLPNGSGCSIVAWGYRLGGGTRHLVGKRHECSHFAYQLAIGPGGIPDDAAPFHTWALFTMTTEAGTGVHRHYVDDQVVETGQFDIENNSADIRIGTSGTCAPFQGFLDEIRIYNRALSQEEVSALYHGTILCDEITNSPDDRRDLPAPIVVESSPNPFNPRTTVSFSVPIGGHARLQIVDLRGRLITTLIDEVIPAGHHEVTWNGRDASGREVPSGVYLSRLESNDQVAHGRMTLVR